MNHNLKGKTWYVIKVHYPADSNTETRMSIGRFKDDFYHVMGYTPDNIRPYCSESEESMGDHGIVILPRERKTLASLVEGAIIHFAPLNHKGDPYSAKFLRRCA